MVAEPLAPGITVNEGARPVETPVTTASIDLDIGPVTVRPDRHACDTG